MVRSWERLLLFLLNLQVEILRRVLASRHGLFECGTRVVFLGDENLSDDFTLLVRGIRGNGVNPDEVFTDGSSFGPRSVARVNQLIFPLSVGGPLGKRPGFPLRLKRHDQSLFGFPIDRDFPLYRADRWRGWLTASTTDGDEERKEGCPEGEPLMFDGGR